jgi:hypothetical protein
MTRYPYAVLVTLSVCTPSLSAQENFRAITTYEVSVPMGDTRRFITAPSWFGLSWEGRWKLARRSSAGVLIGLNEFSDRSDETTNFPSGSATGPQFRLLVAIPFLFTGYVYPIDTKGVRIYVGGGAGFTSMTQMYTLGLQQLGESSWHLVAAPEVGAEIRRFGDFTGIVSVRYNAPLKTGDYIGGGGRSFRYVSIRLGIGE